MERSLENDPPPRRNFVEIFEKLNQDETPHNSSSFEPLINFTEKRSKPSASSTPISKPKTSNPEPPKTSSIPEIFQPKPSYSIPGRPKTSTRKTTSNPKHSQSSNPTLDSVILPTPYIFS